MSYVDFSSGGYNTENGYTVYLTDILGNFTTPSFMKAGTYYEVYKAMSTINDVQYTTIERRTIISI